MKVVPLPILWLALGWCSLEILAQFNACVTQCKPSLYKIVKRNPRKLVALIALIALIALTGLIALATNERIFLEFP